MKAVVQGRNTVIAEMCEYDLNRITPELICEAARRGDEAAREIYEFAGKVIGAGIANVITAVTPRRIVIGGGGGRRRTDPRPDPPVDARPRLSGRFAPGRGRPGAVGQQRRLDRRGAVGQGNDFMSGGNGRKR